MPSSTHKAFAADEFVLIGRGSIEVWADEIKPVLFSAGDIAFFPKGLMCRRRISHDFEQWFAGDAGSSGHRGPSIDTSQVHIDAEREC